jgi:hypothetical protein
MAGKYGKTPLKITAMTKGNRYLAAPDPNVEDTK